MKKLRLLQNLKKVENKSMEDPRNFPHATRRVSPIVCIDPGNMEDLVVAGGGE